jgi:hypothetical protein
MRIGLTKTEAENIGWADAQELLEIDKIVRAAEGGKQ